jgi:hypothetical protein
MATPFLDDLMVAAKAAGSALAPAALGSLVAQLYERGMDWRDRLIAYVVGILVSYYVTLGLTSWFHFDQFVSQAVGFVLAMIAYKAAPKFAAALIDMIASLPATARDWIARKKDVA